MEKISQFVESDHIRKEENICLAVKNIAIRPNDHLQTKKNKAILDQVHMEHLQNISFKLEQIKR